MTSKAKLPFGEPLETKVRSNYLFVRAWDKSKLCVSDDLWVEMITNPRAILALEQITEHVATEVAIQLLEDRIGNHIQDLIGDQVEEDLRNET